MSTTTDTTISEATLDQLCRHRYDGTSAMTVAFVVAPASLGATVWIASGFVEGAAGRLLLALGILGALFGGVGLAMGVSIAPREAG